MNPKHPPGDPMTLGNMRERRRREKPNAEDIVFF
jgi:hypothetical protein